MAIKSTLEAVGLGELFTFENNEPGGWLWDQLRSGIDSEYELPAAIEATDVWQDRFAVIVEQRKRYAAGTGPAPMTVEQVVRYEQTASELMRRYGLPPWFYDNPRTDFRELMLAEISPNELADRISGAYNAVANVDEDTLATFRAFYGPGMGDGAVAAYFLDPDRTEAQLERVALASYAGGIAKDFDLTLERKQAELFFELGRTEAGVAQDLSQINAQSGLLTEGVGEVNDLDEDVAFDAVVRGDADARRLLEGRLIRRQANSRAGVGGALATREGAIGVGSAS
jgi:hypothetical protein